MNRKLALATTLRGVVIIMTCVIVALSKSPNLLGWYVTDFVGTETVTAQLISGSPMDATIDKNTDGDSIIILSSFQFRIEGGEEVSVPIDSQVVRQAKKFAIAFRKGQMYRLTTARMGTIKVLKISPLSPW
jgi:hypothetical protein